MSGFYSNGENFDRIFLTEHQLIDRYVGNRAFAIGGSNNVGELADNTATAKSSPVDFSGLGATWKQLAGGSSSLTVANGAGVKTDGTLWTWGSGTYGALGSNATTSRSSPNSTILGGADWLEVTVGNGGFMAAVKTDGNLYTWGRNDVGQLGTATTTNRSSPAVLTGAAAPTVLGAWLHVAAGGDHCLATKTDGTLWTWGGNTSGELGDGTTTNRSSPQTTILGGNDWLKVSSGSSHNAAIKNDGRLYVWGSNNKGQIGDASSIAKSSPATVAGGGTTWKQVACGDQFTAAVKIDGTLWTWGNNSAGQLGDGTTTSRSSPNTVAGAGTIWKQVSCGYNHTGAVKTDGSIWTWGSATLGQLGDATTTAKSSPITIAGGVSEWQQIVCAGQFAAVNPQYFTLGVGLVIS